MRDYFVVDLALSTGLRVMEIGQLKCGDVFVQDQVALLLVRNGKGGKRRLVRFSQAFKRHYQEYVRWKQALGEPTAPDHENVASAVFSQPPIGTVGLTEAEARERFAEIAIYRTAMAEK